jgi:hypothetical protein
VTYFGDLGEETYPKKSLEVKKEKRHESVARKKQRP